MVALGKMVIIVTLGVRHSQNNGRPRSTSEVVFLERH
jgi:hypothetical protein